MGTGIYAAKRLKNVAATATLLGLFACAPHPTPYQAAGPTPYGYSEQQIETNRFRVSFSGNTDTPRPAVENALLYRAAELTKARGYDYFIVVGTDTEPTTKYWSTIDSMGGFGGWGGHHWGGVGLDIGTATSRPITNYTAYADGVLMKGKKPEDEPRAFSADDVLKTVGPALIR